MSELPHLEDLLNIAGAPLVNWHDIVEEIDREWGRANSSERRTALLEIFQATMNLVETRIADDSPGDFRSVRKRHYKSFIVQESMIGTNVSVEDLDEVTRREIAAGRMAPDDELRKIPEQGMAAPHLSRNELLSVANGKASTNTARGLLGRLFGR